METKSTFSSLVAAFEFDQAILKIIKDFNPKDKPEPGINQNFLLIPLAHKQKNHKTLLPIYRWLLCAEPSQTEKELIKNVYAEYLKLYKYNFSTSILYIDFLRGVGNLLEAENELEKLINFAKERRHLSSLYKLINKYKDFLAQPKLIELEILIYLLTSNFLELNNAILRNRKTANILTEKLIELLHFSKLEFNDLAPDLKLLALSNEHTKDKYTIKERVNCLYSIVASGKITESFYEELFDILCARKRKTMAQKVLETAKLSDVKKEIYSKKINNLKKDSIFVVETDGEVDLAADLFEGDVREIIKKENIRAAELSLGFDKETFMIRMGLLPIRKFYKERISGNEVSNSGELEVELIFSRLLSSVDPYLIQENLDFWMTSSLLMNLPVSCLKIYSRYFKDNLKLDERIRLNYLLCEALMTLEDYERVEKIVVDTVQNLPLLQNEKIAFLFMIESSMKKKGKVRLGISVEKLITNLKKELADSDKV